MTTRATLRSGVVLVVFGALVLGLIGTAAGATNDTQTPVGSPAITDGTATDDSGEVTPLTFGCPGFPPQGPRGLSGGVCLHPSDWHSWHESYRRGDARTFYTSHNGIFNIQINSTSCGINWYRNDYYQWTWVFYSSSGSTGVPSGLRNALDRGTWAC